MGPTSVRAQYPHLYGSSKLPAIEEIFWSTLEQHPSRRQELLRIKGCSSDIAQFSEMHDLDLFRQMSEGEEYSYKRPLQGASKTLTVAKFGLGFSVSEELVDDGKYDLIADMTRKLAKSARESQEIQAMALFNDGFSTQTTNDGVAIFSASHTLPGGATMRNLLTTAADLSSTSLEQALQDFETQQVGDTGIIYRIAPKILLVNPANKRYAKELIASEQKADTANNNINSFKDEGLRVVSSPHLTDTDAWFLLSDPSEHGLVVMERKALATKSEENFDTDSIKYKAMYREIVGATHPYGVFGTPGA